MLARGVYPTGCCQPGRGGQGNHVLEAAFRFQNAVPNGMELRSDHSPQYTGQAAEALASTWGVTQTVAPVGRPTGNALGESTTRTMTEECFWLADWPDA